MPNIKYSLIYTISSDVNGNYKYLRPTPILRIENGGHP